MLYHIILKSTLIDDSALEIYEIDINEFLVVLKFQAAL